MTIVVTGGAGFIGSTLVRALVNAGRRVLTIDKLTYAGNLANLEPIATSPLHIFVHADIGDRLALRTIFAQHRPHAIYHLAAESHVDRSIDAPSAFIETNVVGTMILLETALDYWRGLDAAARTAFRLLHVSTDEVFGELGPTGRFDETSPYRPNSPYAASKAAADHLVRAWHRTYGLPVLISNCSNNYGPYQFPEKLVPLTVLNALRGKPLPIYGQGLNVRDWLYVDDHVAALQRTLTAGQIGETYLIGADAEAQNIEIVRAICRILDMHCPQGAPHERLITFVPDRPRHDMRYAINPARIENELGWRPRYDLRRGLPITVNWYLTNQDWCQRTSAKYDRHRLGLSRGLP